MAFVAPCQLTSEYPPHCFLTWYYSPTQFFLFFIQVPSRDEANAIRPGPGDESQPFQNYGNLTDTARGGDVRPRPNLGVY